MNWNIFSRKSKSRKSGCIESYHGYQPEDPWTPAPGPENPLIRKLQKIKDESISDSLFKQKYPETYEEAQHFSEYIYSTPIMKNMRDGIFEYVDEKVAILTRDSFQCGFDTTTVDIWDVSTETKVYSGKFGPHTVIYNFRQSDWIDHMKKLFPVKEKRDLAVEPLEVK